MDETSATASAEDHRQRTEKGMGHWEKNCYSRRQRKNHGNENGQVSRSILISGGTGSWGSTFLRHLCSTTTSATWRRIICFSRDELKQSELQRTMDDDRLRWFLGDVRDRDRLSLALRDVQVVVHAAAKKRVESMEQNPMEAVKTNVLGSMNVFRACLDNGVEKLLALSTDKACQPITLYGQTKAVMESLLLNGNSYAGTRCSIVRYGNVAFSRGSVVPIWKQYAAQGVPLPLTTETCTRFWITLPHAVTFVEQCLARMGGGELFVPAMPSVRMADVARTISSQIRITGMRAIEKEHEMVVAPHEHVEGLPSPFCSDTNLEWLQGDALHNAVMAE